MNPSSMLQPGDKHNNSVLRVPTSVTRSVASNAMATLFARSRPGQSSWISLFSTFGDLSFLFSIAATMCCQVYNPPPPLILCHASCGTQRVCCYIYEKMADCWPFTIKINSHVTMLSRLMHSGLPQLWAHNECTWVGHVWKYHQASITCIPEIESLAVCP